LSNPFPYQGHLVDRHLSIIDLAFEPFIDRQAAIELWTMIDHDPREPVQVEFKPFDREGLW
jgi:hypothetical protein